MCQKPQTMLEWLRDNRKASERKLRLFGYACVRRIWRLLADKNLWRAIEASERHADGFASNHELGVAVSAAHRVRRKGDDGWRAAYDVACYHPGMAYMNASSAVLYVSSAVGRTAVPSVPPSHISYFDGDRLVSEEVPMNPLRAARNAAIDDEETTQTSLLRDVFGPLPFREIHIDPAWLSWNDGTVRQLAATIYEEPSLPDGTLDNARLAVLTDALEEAGCSNAELLNHCRLPRVHVRGCWVVDLWLGCK
jgi:hypothetical protein